MKIRVQIYAGFFNFWLWRNVHEPRVRTRTMKIIKPWHDGFPPQGLFRSTAGQCGVYHYAYRKRSAAGDAPSGAAGFIASNQEVKSSHYLHFI